MLQFQNVIFRHEQSSQTLLEDVTLQFALGWTGIVGPNGAGKTTLLLLACGQLSPTRGQVRSSGQALYCPQRTDDPPEMFVEFLEGTDGEACATRGRLQIDRGCSERWETLSHGERKRVQIGVALWQAPAVLLLDEPTNHIDAQARALLQSALEAYRGIGLLVSHDRELLDALCNRCLFLEPPSVRLRPGN
jgi:ATPase subunit of ABC transporter with duplicated ATPase domains